MPPDGVPGEPREVWVQLLKTVNGLADSTREWRNCFHATARGLGFETSVLEPCVLVLRSSQQRYHGIIGLAVDDTAGGRDGFTFGQWQVGKGKFCSQEAMQAADGSMRVGQPAYIKSLDFVPLRKLRKEQSEDANETEKVAMRSVLGALGYSARESRPVGVCLNSAKSFHQGSGVRHTRNKQGGQTCQGSRKSRTACLQNSCRSNLFGVFTEMPVVGAHVLNWQLP